MRSGDLATLNNYRQLQYLIEKLYILYVKVLVSFIG